MDFAARDALTAALILVLTVHLTTAQQDSAASAASKLNVAVLDLETRGGITAQEASSASDRLRGELVALGRFIVLERGRMDRILQEQAFQQTGACAEDACIVEVGRLLAVNKMVGGSVGRIGKAFSVNIKVIDVKTGQIERQVADDIFCSKEEFVSFHVRNLARELAGLPKLKAPQRWYTRWYVWTPVVVAGTAAGIFIYRQQGRHKGQTPPDNTLDIPIDGVVK